MFAGIVCALVSPHTLQAEAQMPPANDRAPLLLLLSPIHISEAPTR